MFNLGKKLRHAYSLEGEPEMVKEKLWRISEEELGVAVRGNPDFFYRKFASLGIDEARRIKELAEARSIHEGGRKIFVLEADVITGEAQNSLLKIFEEPALGTHFFILGRAATNLIPTFASRVARIRGTDFQKKAVGRDPLAEKFLTATRMERIVLVKDFVGEIKKEKKNKSDAVALIRDIEEILYQKARREGKTPGRFFEDLEMCREYLGDASASVKMLLDYVALTVPVERH